MCEGRNSGGFLLQQGKNTQLKITHEKYQSLEEQQEPIFHWVTMAHLAQLLKVIVSCTKKRAQMFLDLVFSLDLVK